MNTTTRRRLGRGLATLGLMTAAVLGASAGCSSASDDCAQTNSCGGGGDGGGGDGGSGAGTPAGCIPKGSDEAVKDDCGIWVSLSRGDDANDGSSKAAPKKSLRHAALVAAERGVPRVYACGEVFEEQVEVRPGVTIFGGLDCAGGWVWKEDTKTGVHGPPDVPAVKLLAGDGTTRLEDLEIRASDAETPGASSIGVLAAGVTAELERCAIVAGNGADGAPGAPGDPMPRAQGGTAGNPGRNACTMAGDGATTPGGAQVVNMCEEDGGEPSIGGKGGDGTFMVGRDGEPGEVGTLGQAGLGEPNGAGTWSCATGTGLGYAGEPGVDGDAGTGGTGNGSLSAESGYIGISGNAGTAGKRGQGGGGGGGAKGPGSCPGGATQGSGASGGSGGSGGCGGKPGQGGGAGGSSIALVSIEATLSLNGCALEAGNGGKGGLGGDLQLGGIGGTSGPGGTGVNLSRAGCRGGDGGDGGRGGPGGGGAGGHTLSIAFKGTPVSTSGEIRRLQGSAGPGGLGGDGNGANNAGESGSKADAQEFP
ncbi:uncharacterized protein CMC5_022350 [Chondromyces crocatus]|uniref:PGRS family protein n=1 Tax=Chondromyces crocatus TaxID=52 RepID=A0A0K1EC08_CHOCO|nr:uncharacterized protein CMC5_022350 [Chondromyces crocatus]